MCKYIKNTKNVVVGVENSNVKKHNDDLKKKFKKDMHQKKIIDNSELCDSINKGNFSVYKHPSISKSHIFFNFWSTFKYKFKTNEDLVELSNKDKIFVDNIYKGLSVIHIKFIIYTSCLHYVFFITKNKETEILMKDYDGSYFKKKVKIEGGLSPGDSKTSQEIEEIENNEEQLNPLSTTDTLLNTWKKDNNIKTNEDLKNHLKKGSFFSIDDDSKDLPD